MSEKKIVPYEGYDIFKFEMRFEDVIQMLKKSGIQYKTEYWSNKGCNPEIPWEIIRIENNISLFFAKKNMFKMYFENNDSFTLLNGIHIDMNM